MRHCQEKVVHVLPLVVRFTIFEMIASLLWHFRWSDSLNKQLQCIITKKRLCTCYCLLYDSPFLTQKITLLLRRFKWPSRLYKQLQCVITKRRLCTCCCLLYGLLFSMQTIISFLWCFKWLDRLYTLPGMSLSLQAIATFT